MFSITSVACVTYKSRAIHTFVLLVSAPRNLCCLDLLLRPLLCTLCRLLCSFLLLAFSVAASTRYKTSNQYPVYWCIITSQTHWFCFFWSKSFTATLSSWGSTGILVRHSAEWGSRETTVRGEKRGKGGELDFISLFGSKIRSGASTTQNADTGRPNQLYMTAEVSANVEPRIFG